MIDASTIILGFTGSIGSGCTYISSNLSILGLTKSYKYYKISNIIRQHLVEEGINTPSIKQLQDKGNQLRMEHGSDFLIEKLLKVIDEEWDSEKDYGVIIDGIKNEGEIAALRQFPYFILFSIQALKETRTQRVISNGIINDELEFLHADLRDQREEYQYGQQVARCNYLSDIIVNNDYNIPSAAIGEKDKYIRGFYGRYIKLIEDLRDGSKSPDIVPSIDELCMTIAYVLSKSSSCLKRKVGAVIVEVDEKQADETGKLTKMPFIVSSGYNEVPLGSYECVYNPEYEKCYRDYLQELFAQQLSHCPNCGEKIVLEVQCPFCKEKYDKFLKTCMKCKKEIDFIFNCSNCGKNIFDLYIPGSKEAPGKLLDMCRALHAEEVALLKLTTNYGNNRGNLVMYVTTQPCNLCANKIVLSNIGKVVYAEPYSMKESEDTLKSGNVIAQRFEGVKSSAYFKLYR